MTAGQQPTLDLVNNQLTSCAIRLHALMNEIADLHLQYSVKRGATGLQALAQAQGVTLSASDAADIIAGYDQLGTVAAVYLGGAAQSPAYPFADALALVRGGLTG